MLKQNFALVVNTLPTLFAFPRGSDIQNGVSAAADAFCEEYASSSKNLQPQAENLSLRRALVLLEQKIRQLCEKVIAAATELEAEQAAAELREALHEHVETLRGELILTSLFPILDSSETQS